MSPRSRRRLFRTLHLLFGLCIGTAVYLPQGWADPLRPVLAFVVVPAVVVSGLLMWQEPRLRRLLRRSRGTAVRVTEPSAPADESATVDRSAPSPGESPTMRSTGTLAVWFAVAILAALAAQLWVQATFREVNHPESLGAANLEPDAAVVRGWYEQLLAQQTHLQMIRTEVVDMIWAVCLGVVLVSVYRLVGGALRRVDPPIALMLYRWAPLAALPGVFDLVENGISLAMLTDPFGFPDVWAGWHASVSWLKVIASVASAITGPVLAVVALVGWNRRRRVGNVGEAVSPR